MGLMGASAPLPPSPQPQAAVSLSPVDPGFPHTRFLSVSAHRSASLGCKVTWVQGWGVLAPHLGVGRP